MTFGLKAFFLTMELVIAWSSSFLIGVARTSFMSCVNFTKIEANTSFDMYKWS